MSKAFDHQQAIEAALGLMGASKFPETVAALTEITGVPVFDPMAALHQKGIEQLDGADPSPAGYDEIVRSAYNAYDTADGTLLALRLARDVIQNHLEQMTARSLLHFRNQAFEATRSVHQDAVRRLTKPELLAYLDTYDRFVASAGAAQRHNLARRLLRFNLDVRSWADQQEWTRNGRIDALIKLGRAALWSTAYSDAFFA